MDALLLLACLLVCLIILILIPVILLYMIPVHSELKFTVLEQTLFESFTITWGCLGIGVGHDPQGTQVTVLGGSHVLKTFLPVRASEPVTREDERVKRARGLPSREKIVRLALKIIQPVESLGSLFWRESRFDGANGKITLGLNDPALTGMCYGSYWACRFVLESFRIHIEMEPVFDREVFACDIAIRMSLRHPILFIVAAARVMLNPAAKEFISLFRQDAPGAAAV